MGCVLKKPYHITTPYSLAILKNLIHIYVAMGIFKLLFLYNSGANIFHKDILKPSGQAPHRFH